MENFTREDLKNLLQHRESLCFSMYMPTHPRDANHEQDRIRLKNLLRRAQKTVAEQAADDQGLQSSLESAGRLLVDDGFWSRIGEGLALFVDSNHWSYYRLPLPFEELFVSGRHFYLKPLLPLLTDNGRYYLLALSRRKPRLLYCTRFHATEIELPDLPGSLEETLGYDWEPRSLQFHTGAAGGGGGDRPAMFHGQGAGVDDTKDDVIRYFRRVDRCLQKALSDPEAPLVLAGVEPLPPLYRQVNSYANLMDAVVEKNPDDEKDESLQRRGWEIVAHFFEQSRKEAEERYHNNRGTGYATADPLTVVPAARFGRVDVLFVALGEQLRGRFDPQNSQVRIEDPPDESSEDLLNLAALDTLQNGGTVYAVEPEQVPETGPLAALLRY